MNKIPTIYLYKVSVLSIVIFCISHQCSMVALFSDRIASHWQWAIDSSDKENPIVYYKGQTFSKQSVESSINKLFNQFKLVGIIPNGLSQKIIIEMMGRINEAFDYLANPLNSNGIWRNYVKADLSAQLLKELVNAEQLIDYPYRTDKDIERYYKKWFLTRALLGVTDLGIIDITYWQRDVKKNYLQNAVSSLFNTLLKKQAVIKGAL